MFDEPHDTGLNCVGDEGLDQWSKVLQKHPFRQMVTIKVSSQKSGKAPDLDKETIAEAAPQPDSYMSLSHQPPPPEFYGAANFPGDGGDRLGGTKVKVYGSHGEKWWWGFFFLPLSPLSLPCLFSLAHSEACHSQGLDYQM